MMLLKWSVFLGVLLSFFQSAAFAWGPQKCVEQADGKYLLVYDGYTHPLFHHKDKDVKAKQLQFYYSSSGACDEAEKRLAVDKLPVKEICGCEKSDHLGLRVLTAFAVPLGWNAELSCYSIDKVNVKVNEGTPEEKSVEENMIGVHSGPSLKEPSEEEKAHPKAYGLRECESDLADYAKKNSGAPAPTTDQNPQAAPGPVGQP